MIAGLTLASRGAGLIRILAATSILGVTFLGNTYASANSVPNLFFELVAGGAIAAVIVPALSGAFSRGDREETERIAGALLVRTVVLLTPFVLAGLLLRGPLMDLLTSRVADARIRSLEKDLGELLLLMFLPQIWLYGIGVVLTGVLHTHKRFGPPALAPLLSSIVVVASLLLFAATETNSARDIGAVSARGKLILGLGTTVGVVVLSLSLIPPLIKMRFKFRLGLRLPREAADVIRRLLGSALVAAAVQQALLGVVLVIANGVEGGVVAYQLAFTVLLFPWAVLVHPVAIASYPGLSAAASGDLSRNFAKRCADAVRSTALLAFGGAPLLAATAAPLAQTLGSLGVAGEAPEALIAGAVAGFAPGVIGFGGYSLLTRVAYAYGDGRSAAIGALVGFGSASILVIVAGSLFQGRALVVALAASFSLGMMAGVSVLLARVVRKAGRDAVAGLGAQVLRGSVCGAAAGAAGWILASSWEAQGSVSGSLETIAVAAAVAAAYVLLQRIAGNRQLTKAWSELRGRA